MYEAPITIVESVVEQFQKEKNAEIESCIMKVVASYGIDVDKEELIKALKNDRNQYNKGYNEGINDLAERLKMRSVLCVDELYITIEETEFDELVNELTVKQYE